MTMYNGHKNWNHWNVSLWINNEESLYRHAVELRCKNSAPEAARLMLASLPAKTPDGARYTLTSVRAAMRYIDA